MLGIHCGPDLAVAAAASLVGTSAQQAQAWLAELAAGNLVSEHLPGRFRCHDLLRAYAAELAHVHETEAERHAALRRALDHHLHTAHAANRLLLEHLAPISLGEPAPGVSVEHIADPVRAMAWFTAERPVLLAAVHQAADRGFDGHAWRLAWAVTSFLNRRGLWHVQLDNQRLALAAAQRVGDRDGVAQAHRGLGGANTQLGRHREAEHHLRLALELFAGLGDDNGQASARNGLAFLLEGQGRDPEAVDHRLAALELYRAAGHRAGQATALTAIGHLRVRLGAYQEALACCRRALTLHREAGSPLGEALAWNGIGLAHHHLGRHPEAVDCYRRALGLLVEVGDRYWEAETLVHLGDTHRAAGEIDRARAAWQSALDTLDDIGHAKAGDVRARLRGITINFNTCHDDDWSSPPTGRT
jgi:tetratricopeptide (TPR) repeat protein